MATVNIGDVVQIIQTWDAPVASVAQNVWHLIMASGAGADTDDVLAAVLTQQQIAFATIDDRINNGFEAVLLEARVWDFVVNRFDGVGSLAMTLMVGTSIQDFLTHQMAILGRITTAAARRQGRTFLPGLSDTQITTGVIIAAAETAMAAYLAIFDTDISVTGGLFNWCTFNVDPLSPLFETASVAVQTVIANTLPSTLGKRKIGVGL